ncbi:MAG TPA: ATPase [Spirochaetaceae bacterium]|nr:ATPase [Spirochaetaceae bacterium]HAX38076.1 ATPase [Spirochaetaceae bacterium]HBO42268.1 ATPase [Spirochaetaceae bacterium]HCQ86729.1 ATPase [Spirochaetaceae bacterium]
MSEDNGCHATPIGGTGGAKEAGGAKVKRVIGVASGKGGVGKSTVAVLLAQALAAKGRRVGILDADITGPSVPRLLGLGSFHAETDGERIQPVLSEGGLKVVSINFFVDEEHTPVVWRGPLLSKAVEQFWHDTDWGELDYLIVDFPPGTGDIQITAFNALRVDGLVVAATPQSLVSMIVTKAVRMAGLVDAPVLGVVETMGALTCPHCGEAIPLFDSLDGQSIQAALGLPLLARFPWRKEIAQARELHWDRLPEDITAIADGLAAEVELALAQAKPVDRAAR